MSGSAFAKLRSIEMGLPAAARAVILRGPNWAMGLKCPHRPRGAGERPTLDTISSTGQTLISRE